MDPVLEDVLVHALDVLVVREIVLEPAQILVEKDVMGVRVLNK
jgi:hypothetical protein